MFIALRFINTNETLAFIHICNSSLIESAMDCRDDYLRNIEGSIPSQPTLSFKEMVARKCFQARSGSRVSRVG